MPSPQQQIEASVKHLFRRLCRISQFVFLRPVQQAETQQDVIVVAVPLLLMINLTSSLGAGYQKEGENQLSGK